MHTPSHERLSAPERAFVDQVILSRLGHPGALLGILQSVQEHHPHKYLPRETLEYIAEQTKIPLSSIYSVVTFYALFNLQPDAKPEAGGMLRFALPEYRLPKSALQREIDLIERLGVKFIFNTRIGFDIPLNDLDDRFDAVFISIGTWKESWVYQPGTELKGVYAALMFLEATARGEDVAIGRKVAVIGGGNAAIDSARTALRKGAEVTVFYRRHRVPCHPGARLRKVYRGPPVL